MRALLADVYQIKFRSQTVLSGSKVWSFTHPPNKGTIPGVDKNRYLKILDHLAELLIN